MWERKWWGRERRQTGDLVKVNKFVNRVQNVFRPDFLASHMKTRSENPTGGSRSEKCPPAAWAFSGRGCHVGVALRVTALLAQCSSSLCPASPPVPSYSPWDSQTLLYFIVFGNNSHLILHPASTTGGWRLEALIPLLEDCRCLTAGGAENTACSLPEPLPMCPPVVAMSIMRSDKCEGASSEQSGPVSRPGSTQRPREWA